MSAPDERLPGDAYLDRYLPNLTSEERKIARERLVEFARIVVRAGEKLAARDDLVELLANDSPRPDPRALFKVRDDGALVAEGLLTERQLARRKNKNRKLP